MFSVLVAGTRLKADLRTQTTRRLIAIAFLAEYQNRLNTTVTKNIVKVYRAELFVYSALCAPS